jgi:hypothetical protein
MQIVQFTRPTLPCLWSYLVHCTIAPSQDCDRS